MTQLSPAMNDNLIRSGLLLAVALVVLALPGLAAAQDMLTPEAVSEQLTERFGVEVLKIEEVEEAGRRVYVATVMNPGGNSNAAFQVTRLMVDAATGELVSQFRHKAAGYRVPGGSEPQEATDGRMIRRRSMQRAAGSTNE